MQGSVVIKKQKAKNAHTYNLSLKASWVRVSKEVDLNIFLLYVVNNKKSIKLCNDSTVFRGSSSRHSNLADQHDQTQTGPTAENTGRQ